MRVIDNKAIAFTCDDPAHILDRIKKSADLGDELLVHWGQDEAEQLTRLRVPEVPSPILKDYNWPGRHTPFDHQRHTSSFLSLHERAFCFSEQGTGKTGSVIWAADYLMKLGKIKRVLIICPLSIMKAAWQSELFNTVMHRTCSVAYGSADKRRAIIQEGAEFVIINYDGVGIIYDEIIKANFDLIVIDEANALKNARTQRWKTINRIINQTQPRVWMLTGTPAAQSPADAFGLAKIVNPEGCPRLFDQFRDKVMYKATKFKWVPKPGCEEHVHKVLQPAIRYEKRDCLDLPPVLFAERDAPLTSQQKKYYAELKERLVMEADGEQITAVNAAVKIMKLLQISGGCCYGDSGEVVEFDVSNRVNVVLEAVQETTNKVLIFIPFKHTFQLVGDALDKTGISYGTITGDVSLNKRSDYVKRFQEEKYPQVMLMQPAAASHGLTLTAADTIIWYAPVTSVETYLQANARIDRPGQKNTMTIMHIKGSDVEAKLYAALRSNINTHQKIVDLYKEIINA